MRGLVVKLLLALASAATRASQLHDREYFSLSSNVTLPYALFVPSAYDGTTPAPLVVALHGHGDTPQTIMQYPRLLDLADSHGFVVVAPMGYSPRG